MKISVIGGGGSRAMMLAKSLLQKTKPLGINEIVFMDTNEETLHIFGGMIIKAASIINNTVKVSYTMDAVTAILNSDFVITTIRVGGDEARVYNEQIAIAHEIIGQETTGAGGFAMALEAIPVLADYCNLIRKYAKKDVLVFNFSNPAGLVTQAMRDLGYEFVYGVCDAPTTFLRQVALLRKRPYVEYHMNVFGLNHLSYFTTILEGNKDITNELLIDPKLYTETDMRYFEPELPYRWGMLLNEYLYYYYYREKAFNNIAKSSSTRGELIKFINKMMLEDLKNLKPEEDFEKMLEIYSKYNHQRELSYMSKESLIQKNEATIPKFDFYSLDDGGYAGIAVSFIKAKITGINSEMVLCIPNNGTADWLSDDDVVESTCEIGAFGAKTKKGMKELPDSAKVLIKTIKQYERLAVQAILNKDSALAVEALMIHPLVNSYSIAKSLVKHYFTEKTKDNDRWRV